MLVPGALVAQVSDVLWNRAELPGAGPRARGIRLQASRKVV